MSDKLLTSLGDLGTAIDAHIKESTKQILSELVEPIAVLKEFEGIDVLKFDEACRVFRCEDKNDAIRLREACNRGEIPHVKVGRDLFFPKRLLVQFLLGEWRQPEKVKVERSGKWDDLDEKVDRAFAN